MTTRETSAYIRQNIQCHGGDARQAAPRRARDRRIRSDHRDTPYPATPGNIHENHALTRITGGADRWLHTPESRQTSGDPSGDRRRDELWDQIAADAPVSDLRPCILCETYWPDAALAPRTRLCPVCVEEIRDRQAAEASEDDRPEDLEACRGAYLVRRRAEIERIRPELRRLIGLYAPRVREVDHAA